MPYPLIPKAGDEVKASHLESIVNWVKQLIPKGDGKTTKVTSTQNGVTISAFGSDGVQVYLITTTSSSTCTVQSLSDDDGDLKLFSLGAASFYIPTITNLDDIPSGTTLLAYKIGSFYVADTSKWI